MSEVKLSRNRDVEILRAAFWAEYDASRVSAILRRWASGEPAPGRVLGEGEHYQAIHLQAIPGLVLKKAKDTVGVPGSPERRQWQAAFGRLKMAKDLPLVPPMELLEAGGALGLVMPFGDQPMANAAQHWQPIADVVADLRRQLEGLGLELADTAQGRARKGTPFLYDFSDLRPSSSYRR